MFVQDYSGFAKAGAIQGQMFSNMGQQVEKSVDAYSAMKKEQSGLEKDIKTSELIAKALAQKFPDLAPMAQEAMSIMGDKNRTLDERHAASKAVDMALNVGMDSIYKDRSFALQQQGMELDSMKTFSDVNRNNYMTNAQMDSDANTLDMKRLIGPAQLEAAIAVFDNLDPAIRQKLPFSDDFLGQARGMSPEQQADVASLMIGTFPEQEKRKLQTVPASFDGQPGELGVLVDAYGNIDLPNIPGMDDGPGVLPDILLNDGTNAPAPPPTEQGRRITPGRTMISPKETPDEALAKSRLTGEDARLTAITDHGDALGDSLPALDNALRLLDEIKTGFSAQMKMEVKRVFGVDVSNEEQFQSAAGQFVMDNISLTKGSISDKEMAYFKDELSPGMGKSNEGNRKIVEFKRQYAQRAKEIAKYIRNGKAAGISPFAISQGVDEIMDQYSLVPASGTPLRQSPVSSATQELDEILKRKR
jgi:hypothetical protein